MTFKTALVTGGGRGIGSAISKLLAARGTNVIVNYLSNKESAERVVSEIKARKDAAGPVGANGNGLGDALAIQADVRDANQVQQMVDEAIKQFGNMPFGLRVLELSVKKQYLPVSRFYIIDVKSTKC
jgi:NAD(P)-dependent dehydrogenase (short-subunit alcohol dehydrogenase family)